MVAPDIVRHLGSPFQSQIQQINENIRTWLESDSALAVVPALPRRGLLASSHLGGPAWLARPIITVVYVIMNSRVTDVQLIELNVEIFCPKGKGHTRGILPISVLPSNKHIHVNTQFYL